MKPVQAKFAGLALELLCSGFEASWLSTDLGEREQAVRQLSMLHVDGLRAATEQADCSGDCSDQRRDEVQLLQAMFGDEIDIASDDRVRVEMTVPALAPFVRQAPVFKLDALLPASYPQSPPLLLFYPADLSSIAPFCLLLDLYRHCLAQQRGTTVIWSLIDYIRNDDNFVATALQPYLHTADSPTLSSPLQSSSSSPLQSSSQSSPSQSSSSSPLQSSSSSALPSGRARKGRRDGSGKGLRPFAHNKQISLELQAQLRQRQESSSYASIRQQRDSLPVVQTLGGKLLSQLDGHTAAVIAADTGSGKSSQVPQLLFEELVERGLGGGSVIICTQPRRLSATALAARVAYELQSEVGQLVGYAIRQESRRSAATRILFTTTGYLLRLIATSDPLLASTCTHLIIDEVHERSQEIDFLLALLRLFDAVFASSPWRLPFLHLLAPPLLGASAQPQPPPGNDFADFVEHQTRSCSASQFLRAGDALPDLDPFAPVCDAATASSLRLDALLTLAQLPAATAQRSCFVDGRLFQLYKYAEPLFVCAALDFDPRHGGWFLSDATACLPVLFESGAPSLLLDRGHMSIYSPLWLLHFRAAGPTLPARSCLFITADALTRAKARRLPCTPWPTEYLQTISSSTSSSSNQTISSSTSSTSSIQTISSSTSSSSSIQTSSLFIQPSSTSTSIQPSSTSTFNQTSVSRDQFAAEQQLASLRVLVQSAAVLGSLPEQPDSFVQWTRCILLDAQPSNVDVQLSGALVGLLEPGRCYLLVDVLSSGAGRYVSCASTSVLLLGCRDADADADADVLNAACTELLLRSAQHRRCAMCFRDRRTLCDCLPPLTCAEAPLSVDLEAFYRTAAFFHQQRDAARLTGTILSVAAVASSTDSADFRLTLASVYPAHRYVRVFFTAQLARFYPALLVPGCFLTFFDLLPAASDDSHYRLCGDTSAVCVSHIEFLAEDASADFLFDDAPTPTLTTIADQHDVVLVTADAASAAAKDTVVYNQIGDVARLQARPHTALFGGCITKWLYLAVGASCSRCSLWIHRDSPSCHCSASSSPVAQSAAYPALLIVARVLVEDGGSAAVRVNLSSSSLSSLSPPAALENTLLADTYAHGPLLLDRPDWSFIRLSSSGQPFGEQCRDLVGHLRCYAAQFLQWTCTMTHDGSLFARNSRTLSAQQHGYSLLSSVRRQLA